MIMHKFVINIWYAALVRALKWQPAQADGQTDREIETQIHKDIDTHEVGGVVGGGGVKPATYAQWIVDFATELILLLLSLSKQAKRQRQRQQQ